MPALPFAALPAATDTDRRAVGVYLASRAPGTSTATAANVLDALARLLGCGCRASCAWTALDYEHAVYLRRALSEGRTPRTVNTYLSILRGLARICLDAGIGDAERWTRLLKVKYVAWEDDEEPGRALDAAEVAAMLAACDHDPSAERGARDRFLLQLLWATGLRVSTVAALRWPESLTGAALTVTTKGNKRHTVPLDATVTAALASYLAIRGDWPGALFVQVTRGRPPHRLLRSALTRSGVYEIVMRRSTEAGLERATPHDFRRTAITELIDVAGLRAAQLIAGHKSPAMTAKYDKRGIRRMEAAVKLRPLPGRDDGRGDVGAGAPDSDGDEHTPG